MHDSTNSTVASNRGWPSTGQCWQAPDDLRRRAHGEAGKKGGETTKEISIPQGNQFVLNRIINILGYVRENEVMPMREG